MIESDGEKLLKIGQYLASRILVVLTCVL